jgi:hypothetical protein
MADKPEDLTQVHLRAIDIKLDRVAEDVREIKTRVGILEHQYASVSTRIPLGDIRRVRLPAPILIDRQVRFLMLIVHAQEGGAFVSVAIKSKT